MYVGAPGGGIWKTTDGGAAWAAVGDSLPTLGVAALAVDPITPSRVYAVLAGAGIFRSDDRAVTWTLVHADLGTPVSSQNKCEYGLLRANWPRTVAHYLRMASPWDL